MYPAILIMARNLTGLQRTDCSNVIHVAKSVFSIDHVENLSGLALKLELLQWFKRD